jgi:hypothetical protein
MAHLLFFLIFYILFCWHNCHMSINRETTTQESGSISHFSAEKVSARGVMSPLTTIHDEGDGLNTWWPTLTDEVMMTTSNFSCAGTDRLVTPQIAFLAFFSALSCMPFCICLIQQVSYASCWIMPLWWWYYSSWHSEPTKSHRYLASSNLMS